MIRPLFAVTALLLSFFIQPAYAENVDASTVTCTEMLEVGSRKDDPNKKDDSKARIGIMLIWLQGYQAPADHGTVADIKGIMDDIDRVVDMCKASPNLGLMTVTEKLWAENSEPSKSATDLSTVKCNAMMTMNETDRTSTVVWLLGYNAATDNDPMFDLDAVGDKVTNLAKYCTENPEMGLVTASDKAEE